MRLLPIQGTSDFLGHAALGRCAASKIRAAHVPSPSGGHTTEMAKHRHEHKTTSRLLGGACERYIFHLPAQHNVHVDGARSRPDFIAALIGGDDLNVAVPKMSSYTFAQCARFQLRVKVEQEMSDLTTFHMKHVGQGIVVSDIMKMAVK